jgi:outer membrane receptor for ferrienterochelin and colicins
MKVSYRLKIALLLLWPAISVAQTDTSLNVVVISGSLRPVKRVDSPVPVEVYTRQFFKSNPTPHVFEAMQLVNGLQPQVNCNVCSAGDIHINGMEGAYTMVTIDGMPLMSSLGTVYGLMGIPPALLQRVEVMKGAASTLYGSEAMAGVINLITREPGSGRHGTLELFTTSDREVNLDLGWQQKFGKWNSLSAINGFTMHRPFDRNEDGFTDIPVQQRYALFQKFSRSLPGNRKISLAIRRFDEMRWGGQTHWRRELLGSDSVYGEHIITGRSEVLGAYDLPIAGRPKLQFSYVDHRQRSWYGTMPFNAVQQIMFAQLLWHRDWKGLNWTFGLPFRYTRYDDNTPATPEQARTLLPGALVQADGTLREKLSLTAGLRGDWDMVHGPVYSPRLALMWHLPRQSRLRFNAGTGYRVVNVFTEDHAALSGARQVYFREALAPERSVSWQAGYSRIFALRRSWISVQSNFFHTRFSNKIIADYDTDPKRIIYGNLDGYALSRGVNLDADFSRPGGTRGSLGITLMDVYFTEPDSLGSMQHKRQVHTPPFSFSGMTHIRFGKGWFVDLSARVFSPMRLPVVPNDYRPAQSPWYGIANVQILKQTHGGMELYGGVRNLFNFVPKDPLLRPFDPFNKDITRDNPNGYTFDTAYNYASMQGRRLVLGVRLVL